MIGYEDYADTITAIAWHERENVDANIRLDSYGDIPEGWEYVGSGSYRHCFRGPCGNVYKVSTAWSREYGGGNEESWDKYLMLDAIGARVAKCDYFTESNVMVQEWVEGDVIDPEYDTEEYIRAESIVRSWAQSIGRFVDFHSENFRLVDGDPVLIDW